MKLKWNLYKIENEIVLKLRIKFQYHWLKKMEFSLIRLDQELMKSFEELTYNFQEFIQICGINVKFKNRESFKNREKQLEAVFLGSWNFSLFLHAMHYI